MMDLESCKEVETTERLLGDRKASVRLCDDGGKVGWREWQVWCWLIVVLVVGGGVGTGTRVLVALGNAVSAYWSRRAMV